MQSDSAKSDGTNSDWRIRWRKSSDFGLGPSEYQSKNGIDDSGFNQVKMSLRRAWDTQQYQYEVHKAAVRVAIDALNYEYDHGVRTKSPRLSADRLQLSGDASSALETKISASSARLWWLRIIREYAASSSHRTGLGCHVKRLGTSLRGRTGSQGRVGRLSPGPSDVHSVCLFAAPDTAVVDVGLKFQSPNTNYCRITPANKRTTRAPSTDPISHKKPVSICTNEIW